MLLFHVPQSVMMTSLFTVILNNRHPTGKEYGCHLRFPLAFAATTGCNRTLSSRNKPPMTSEAPNPAQPSIVFPDADIVLRSSDHMTFHVNKAVLRKASQHFRSMFAIAPPDSQEIQVLDIEVQGSALLLLLQSESLYNFTLTPELGPTVDEVLAVIQAAEKLEFDSVEQEIRQGPLVTALASEPNPLRAWAIAMAQKLPEAAEAAARRYFLSPDDFRPQWHSLPELSRVSAMEFNTLIRRRVRVINALQTEACNIVWGLQWRCITCRDLAESQSHMDPEDIPDLPPVIEGRSAFR
ncbi:hypothetical protein DL93DRAFT_582915 [Clavulina sp. PMI_390]|nr:hypothetical protein DL93DRAFT_582915 [Clavulina sp. PMI_390]